MIWRSAGDASCPITKPGEVLQAVERSRLSKGREWSHARRRRTALRAGAHAGSSGRARHERVCCVRREGDWEACGGAPARAALMSPCGRVGKLPKTHNNTRGVRGACSADRVCAIRVLASDTSLRPFAMADVSVFDYCIWIGCAPSVVAQSLLCRSRGGAHWAAALLRRVRRARRRGRGRVRRTACVRRRHCGVWCEPREVRLPRCAR